MRGAIYLQYKDGGIHVARILRERDHLAVEIDGDEYCTCDTLKEAEQEIENYKGGNKA